MRWCYHLIGDELARFVGNSVYGENDLSINMLELLAKCANAWLSISRTKRRASDCDCHFAQADNDSAIHWVHDCLLYCQRITFRGLNAPERRARVCGVLVSWHKHVRPPSDERCRRLYVGAPDVHSNLASRHPGVSWQVQELLEGGKHLLYLHPWPRAHLTCRCALLISNGIIVKAISCHR